MLFGFSFWGQLLQFVNGNTAAVLADIPPGVAIGILPKIGGFNVRVSFVARFRRPDFYPDTRSIDLSRSPSELKSEGDTCYFQGRTRLL